MALRYKKRGGKKQMKRRLYKRKLKRVQTDVLRVKETFDAGIFTGNSGYALGVSLNALPQLPAYQALYQKFRITGAKFTFIPHYAAGEINQANANAAATPSVSYGGIARITTSIARGVMSAPANEVQMLSRTHKLHVMDVKPFSVYVKNPVFGVDANPGGATTETKWTTGFLGVQQSSDVIHQGLEWYVANPGPNPYQLRMFVTLYVTFTEAI